MSKSESLASGVDFIDTMAGISDEHGLYAVRHARKKVVDATEASQQLFFRDDLPGLSLAERYLVAWYASLLSKAPSLAGEYRRQLHQFAVSDEALMAIEFDRLNDMSDTRLSAILSFTRLLVLSPKLGDQQALLRLKEAGLSTPEVVALAQLIGYLSYQIRLVAGLQAMKALEEAK
ncbi:CMD domain protein [Paenalcaligenes niemegkensis]|uniref:CMD domain-containing protein n=1 Tax=Paenalcaligenes niemegkensis TaxID=2895469 RepID=UPI001EE891A1|nr:CMD domain protein [Paenalcaligenes niemegkensis]MCQ9617642.1 CMD domain protein [Paenalcaligenes niemegkensis]